MKKTMKSNAESSTEELVTSLSDNILNITLNRPNKKNALNYSMYKSLAQLLKKAEESPEIHVVVLTGSGDYFTAGNDLASFKSGVNLAYNEKPSFHFMNTLSTFKKPIIAAVNGDAIGIGVTLLMHCDLVYATESCHFKMPFLAMGLIPECASTLLMTDLLGHSKAAELLMLGERFSSKKAVDLNIINQTLPSDTLMDIVLERALNLASKPTAAVQTTKRLMKQRSTERVLSVIDEEAREFSKHLQSPETQAIVASFLTKTKRPTATS